MTTARLIAETAFDLHEKKYLSRTEQVRILQQCVNAAALDNGYAEKYDLPFPGQRRRRRIAVPHDWCPPSRRGHTWREAKGDENLEILCTTALDRRTVRICKRCGKLGCISSQGVIKEIP